MISQYAPNLAFVHSKQDANLSKCNEQQSTVTIKTGAGHAKAVATLVGTGLEWADESRFRSRVAEDHLESALQVEMGQATLLVRGWRPVAAVIRPSIGVTGVCQAETRYLITARNSKLETKAGAGFALKARILLALFNDGIKTTKLKLTQLTLSAQQKLRRAGHPEPRCETNAATPQWHRLRLAGANI